MDDFKFDDDFNVDTGIEIDGLNDTEIDFGDTKKAEETKTFQTALSLDKKEDTKSVKKTAIIASAIGIGVIILGFALVTLVKPKESTNIKHNVTDVDNKPPVIVNKTQEQNEWVELKQDDYLSMNKEVNSRFTVTSIKHLAKKINENNVILVKSIVKGNISGLVGTYEVEMPYDKAKYLKNGTEFKITYTMMEKNDVKIIGEIRYQHKKI